MFYIRDDLSFAGSIAGGTVAAILLPILVILVIVPVYLCRKKLWKERATVYPVVQCIDKCTSYCIVEINCLLFTYRSLP